MICSSVLIVFVNHRSCAPLTSARSVPYKNDKAKDNEGTGLMSATHEHQDPRWLPIGKERTCTSALMRCTISDLLAFV